MSKLMCLGSFPSWMPVTWQKKTHWCSVVNQSTTQNMKTPRKQRPFHICRGIWMQPGHLSHPMTVKSNYWLFKMKALWEVGPFMEEDVHQLFYWKGRCVILASVNPRNSAAKWLWKDHSCGKTNVKKGSFMLLLGPLKIVALCLPIGARNRGIERDRKGISVLQLLQHHHYLVRDSWQPMNQLTILSLDPSKSCHLRQGGWTHFGPSGRGPPCRRFAWTRVWQVAASKVPDCRHFGASWPCCSSSSSWMVQGLREWLHHWNFTLGEYRNVISEPINAEGLNQQQWMPSHRTLDLHDVRRKCRHGYFTFSWFITKSESYSPDVRRRRRRTTTKLLSAPLKPGTQ